MSHIPINEDALFRAVTAFQHKVMAYYLDLRTGEVTSRTLRPDEVQEPPPGPSVKPLPVIGGELSKKEDDIFGAPPPKKESLAGLFGDEGPKKKEFEDDFWKRDNKKKGDLFNDGGFRRESSSKKLAELFGEGPGEKMSDRRPAPVADVPSTPKPAAPSFDAPVPEIDYSEPLQRIPPANEKQHLEWLHAFAKDCGDPKIKEELQHALAKAKDKPMAAFEKVLRNYQRMNQQWEKYYRKQARHYAEEWLKPMPVQFVIVESES